MTPEGKATCAISSRITRSIPIGASYGAGLRLSVRARGSVLIRCLLSPRHTLDRRLAG